MFHVLSFDPEKVMMISASDGRAAINKKTTEKEYRNMLLARQHLLKYQPILVSETYGNIRVSVAEILGWNSEKQLLFTLFYQGQHFEGILRETIGTERNALMGLIKRMFETFKAIGFLWGDFAPRNMIWDQLQKAIWLVDFERNLYLRDRPIEHSSFSRYIRSYSMEEFSCFLTEHERATLLDDLIDKDVHEFIPISQITSKRKCSLLKTLFGEKECYSSGEVRQIEDLMVSISAPFQINDAFFFPIDPLDLIGSKGGPNEYTRTVMAIRNLGKYERFSELKKRAKAF